jgi:glucose/arabinose dehydrogenase
MVVAALLGMRLSISCVVLTVVSSLASAQQQPAAPPPDVVSSSAGSLRVERLATLESPWGIALLPDGRVLVTEKAGRLRIFSNGQLSAPVTGVPAVVSRPTQFEQGGLLDVAVDPAFASNGYIYLSYSEAAAQPSTDATETGELRFGEFVDMTDNIIRGGAVARARLVGNALQDVQVIWRQVPKTVGRGHFGNRMVFGPDGKLYITSGDRMRFDPAQQLSSSLGKVLRINSDGSIPADNPFASRQGARGDIYSYGHRNMLAATFDANGRLWVIEMGPLGGDELNLIQPGRNYGWPQVSNGDNYAGPSIPDHPTKKEYQEPVRTWTPVVSASGALLYTGAMYPAWRNSLIAGGLSSMSIIRLVIDGERVAHEERIWMGRRIRDVLQMPDGSIVAIVDDKTKGDLLRLAPTR